jgi:outer membrane immunogenic protein
MKKVTLGLIISGVFSALVYAGPEQYSGKEMKQVAPMPPPCPNWTGFYIGGFGGYKFGATDTNLSLGGGWDADAPDRADRDLILSNSPNDLDTSGFEAGGLVGYNYQWNKWVFGLEASGGYLWLDQSHDTGIFTVPTTQDTYSVATSFKTHYLITVGPRIGYTFCRWMPYVTGGLAIGDIDFHQTITQFNIPFQEGGNTSDTKVGWMVGGGLEYAITDHWRARAQYQYVDLGGIGFDHSTPGFNVAGVPVDFSGHSEVNLREHNASFAIIYGF